MVKDTSTSSSNRFSFNSHSVNITNSGSSNSNNGVLPSYNYPGSRDRSPDLELSYGTSTCNSSSNNTSNNRTIKKSKSPSRTPSPPILSDGTLIPFPPFLKRRLSNKSCLLCGALTIGLLLPIWIFTTGVITLDSFNDTVRYLPGYHYFANNLLYLVMFLLLVSFSVLATLPILPIFILGLPFHLLIFSIFNKLMSDWLWWCIGCYFVLFLAPVGSAVLARIKGMVVQHCDNNNCGRDSPIRQKSSSYVKYSPLRSNDNNSNNIINNCAVNNNNSTIINNLSANEDHDPLDMIFESLSSQQPSFRPSTRMAFIGRRVEYGVYLFSKSNRNSTRWRLLLAMTFWLSYVIPVTLKNEARDFNPSQAAPSFDIHHPEWLCPPTSSDESSQNNFEDYWQEYLNFHQEMVLPEAQGGVPDNEKRFLIFQPSDDGLGNRLQALLSSVVMAMITRRAIILDWLAMPQCNANFTDLFQQPENLAWDLNSTLPLHKEMPTYKSKPEIWYPYCRNCALRSPITPESTWSTLLCDADLGLNASAPIIQIFSTQWFLPVIQHNRHWKRELCNMFPHGGKNAFQILAQKLLKPSRVVQDKIDSVMDRIPKDATLIGLQVRRTENNAVGQAIEDSFLSCAADVVQEEEMKPGRSRMNIEEQYNYDNEQHQQQQQQIASESSSIIQTGHNLRRDAIVALDTSDNRRPFASSIIRQSLPKTPGQFAYYLATDYRPTRAHFQEALGDQLYVLDNTFQTTKATVSGSDNFKNNKIDNNISAPGTESGHQNTSITSSVSLSFSSSSTNPSQTEAVVRNSVQGVQTAVAEMFLLAQSDRIISSPYSTFGYFAHGYANIQPNIVKRDGTCIQRRSTQPCFQYWFGFANGGAKCTIRSTIEMSEDYDCWL